MANPTDIELQDLTIVQEVKYVPNDVNNEEKTTLQTMWLKLQFDPRKQRNLLVAIGVFAALIILAIFITLGVVLSQTEDLINDKLYIIGGLETFEYCDLLDNFGCSLVTDTRFEQKDYPTLYGFYPSECDLGIF